DALWAEFEAIRGDIKPNRFSKPVRFEDAKPNRSPRPVRFNFAALQRFHDKIASLRFFDPACGCGNFLVVAYRELRLLELEVITALYGGDETLKFEVEHYVKVNVSQFYGIEIEEFPSQIAQTAMWLTDHQMNLRVRDRFGQYFARIPLTASPTIVCGNSLTIDWQTLLNKENVYTVRAKHAVLYVAEPTVQYGKVNVVAESYSIQKQEDIPEGDDTVELVKFNYIFGNPPFLGARIMSKAQKADVERIFSDTKNCGNLDYVTCWYRKAAEYIQNTRIECAFVSTNSICQGEHVPVLWQMLMNRFGIKINFAHQTFKWTNEARGKAAVHCIVVGFSRFDRKEKRLYTYKDIRGKAEKVAVKQINPYLIDADTVFIESRKKPLCDVPEMGIGNKPIDGGNYLFTPEEKAEFVKIEPQSERWFRPWVGSEEFINGFFRYCLWLGDCPPAELRRMPEAMRRVEAVRRFRLDSKSLPTQKIADFPRRFHVENMPQSNYIVIPETSSERRKYVPIGFLTPDILCSNAIRIIPNATLYHFGILTSSMHNVWIRYIGGRLKSDYRYSKDIVYNNFPWCEASDGQRQAIEERAQAVLDIRAKYMEGDGTKSATLADLYDPITMPADLLKAHQSLDREVDKAYGRAFADDAERVAFLFERYKELTKDLFAEKEKNRK
ncbi:MAG: hypothetical protein LBR50_01100, partial [Tannerella sp.]|nr:hypothetical protein [Tannerella sp.]